MAVTVWGESEIEEDSASNWSGSHFRSLQNLPGPNPPAPAHPHSLLADDQLIHEFCKWSLVYLSEDSQILTFPLLKSQCSSERQTELNHKFVCTLETPANVQNHQKPWPHLDK